MQILNLERKWFTAKSTIGVLTVGRDHEFECYTLEDTVRDKKVPGQTAIPEGVYEVTIGWSPKRQRYVPWLKDVRDFTAIQIHTGNTPEDTDGCILVGQRRAEDRIMESQAAYKALYSKIEGWIAAGERIFILVYGQVKPLEPEA